jgi:hypothetical protein
MRHRNFKAEKVVKAFLKWGCILKRKTSHGVIVENPKNNKSINIPTHQKILPVWIYKNVLRQLEIEGKEIEEYI